MSKADNMTGDLASNAFNQGAGYSYSHDDLRRVGEQLMPKTDSAILAFPLGSDTIDVPTELRKFREDLDSGKKVAGAYCTGGHWIAYVMFKDGEQYKAWYKDASGGGDGGLAGFLTAAFPGIEIKAANNSAEQASGGTCGIFALRNAIVFAHLSDEALRAEALLAPFVTEAEIANDRVNFAKLFAKSVIAEVYNDVIHKEISNIHNLEADSLQAILVGVESVSSISNEDSGYVYRVKCKIENIPAAHSKLASILSVVPSPTESGSCAYFSIDPRALRPDVHETNVLREMVRANSNGSVQINKIEVLRLVLENLYIASGNEAQFASLEGIIAEDFPALKTTVPLSAIGADTQSEYQEVQYGEAVLSGVAEVGENTSGMSALVEGVAALGGCAEENVVTP